MSHNTTENISLGLTRLINGRQIIGNQLVEGEDLWICSVTGKILDGRDIFFNHHAIAENVIDLEGRIVAPGFIDVQLNGAFGFDFSKPSNINLYAEELDQVNKRLITTGVTSYLPTLTTSVSQLYHEVLPFLGPSGESRDAEKGSESLGAHCEGPFLSPTKNGIHNPEVLQPASLGWEDFETCYGIENLKPVQGEGASSPMVKMITAAPELGSVRDTISTLVSRNIVFSIGHTEATYSDACDAVKQGATMITHLFNAMKPLHHRNPGVIGLLTESKSLQRPYYGIIADGIHLHPTTIKLAFSSHPEGCILVTDAMHLAGMADGVYDWTNGDRIVKNGSRLTLENSPDKIARSSISLIECVNNFINKIGGSIPEAIGAVTTTPAKMLKLYPQKGSLVPGADADLVILDEVKGENTICLEVNRVFKFGKLVFDAHK